MSVLLVLVSAFTLVGLNRLPPEQVLIEEDTLGFNWGKSYPEKTPYLQQIFYRRIDRATRGRQLPEQTPPGFSPDPL